MALFVAILLRSLCSLPLIERRTFRRPSILALHDCVLSERALNVTAAEYISTLTYTSRAGRTAARLVDRSSSLRLVTRTDRKTPNQFCVCLKQPEHRSAQGIIRSEVIDDKISIDRSIDRSNQRNRVGECEATGSELGSSRVGQGKSNLP